MSGKHTQPMSIAMPDGNKAMRLMSIQKDAQEIAAFICEIVGVDVVIVDDEMARVTDTFRYPYSRIDIHTNSIIGNIVSSGLPQVVENKNYFKSCVVCSSRERCEMQGLIGVPILYRGSVIGAMGLVLERHNAKRLLESVSLVLTFLSQIAGLLSSKLSSQAEYTNLQRMSSQWADMLDTVDSGVVLVDEKDNIVVHNKRFGHYFQAGEDRCHGRPLTELVDHPLVAESLQKRVDRGDRPIIVPLSQSAFCGSFQVKPLWQDGVYCGAVFTFRDSSGLPSDNLLLYHGCKPKETVRQICGASAVGEKLQRCLHDPERRDQPLLLCGASEESLLRLAVAFHNSAGRTGQFVLINGKGLYEAGVEKNPFLSLEDTSEPLLRAHRGTLCVMEVFALPVYIQRWFLSCLRSGEKSPGKAASQGSFQTHFVFLSTQPAREEDSLFRDPELAEILRRCQIDVPDPMRTPRRLQALLKQSLDHFSACYGKAGMTVEPDAWDLLLAFPWEKGEQGLYKAVEYLVRSGGNVITRRDAARLLEQMGAPDRSAKDYERQEIERLLNSGVSCDQIANILHISRATLYRRIKKYQLKAGKDVTS